MTRVYVYSLVLAAFAASTAMIVASIFQTNWISYYVSTPKGDQFNVHVGLHERCFSTHDPPCKPYPPPEMCGASDTGRYFCHVWKTAGFFASFSAILCLATLVCFLIVMSGGKYRRETGWPLVSGMLTVVAIVQFFVISAVSFLFDKDDQFTLPGWYLDSSWNMSLASAIISLFAAIGLAATAYMLPPDQGYDFLEDPAVA